MIVNNNSILLIKINNKQIYFILINIVFKIIYFTISYFLYFSLYNKNNKANLIKKELSSKYNSEKLFLN
jgi:hypothetical protein